MNSRKHVCWGEPVFLCLAVCLCVYFLGLEEGSVHLCARSFCLSDRLSLRKKLHAHMHIMRKRHVSVSVCVFTVGQRFGARRHMHPSQGPTSCSTPAGQTAPRVDKNGVAAGQASLLKPNAQKGMKAERTDRTSLGNARRGRQTRDGSDRSDDAEGPQDALGASRRSRAS